MKHQRFTEVGEKIRGTVVTGIEVEFVPDAFCLELPVKFRSSFIKPEFIFPAAVEVDRQPRSPYRRPVLLGEEERAVLVPVMEINGITENRSHQPT
jgi:hypothetical protein